MGQRGMPPPHLFICCAVGDRRQHPGQERREKEFETFAKTSDIG